MTKINEISNRLHGVYQVCFLIILVLPILVRPPYFFPVDWGKALIFRSVMAIIIFLFAFQLLFRKNQLKAINFKENTVFWCLAVFFGVSLLATIFSVDPLFSFWGSPYRGGGFINLAFCIVFAVLTFILFKESDWKKAWIVSIIIGVLVSFVAIGQYFGLFNLLASNRPSSTMGNPDILATYLLLLSFLTSSFTIKENANWKKIAYIFSIIVFISTILITGSRAVYLGLLVGVVYFVVTCFKKVKIIKYIFAGILVLALGFVVYANAINKYPNFLQQNKLFSSVVSRLSIDSVTKDPRLAAWQIAIKALEAKPLLGYGPENFSVGFDKYYDPNIPNINADASWYDKAHNIILDIGNQTGILGMIAYLILFVVLLWQLQKIKSDDENKLIARGIQATLIGYLCTNLFGFDTFSTYLIFFLLISYSLHIIAKNQPQTTSQELVKSKNTWWKPVFVTTIFIILIIFLWQYNLVPLQINAKINKASILVDQKKCDQAFEVLNRVLLEHSFLDSYIRLQYVQFERTCATSYPKNNLSYTIKGVELLNEAVKLQPLYTRYWIFLGNLTTTLAEQENDQTSKDKLLLEADGYLNKALELAPEHQEIFTAKAKIQIDEKNYSNAKNESEKCIALYSSFPDCYFYLALSNIYLQDTGNADKNIQIAISNGYNINSEARLVELGNAYNSIQDYKNLAIVFEKLITVNPEAIQYHSSLAVVYAKLGEYSNARQEAGKVLQISPASKQNVDAFLKTLP